MQSNDIFLPTKKLAIELYKLCYLASYSCFNVENPFDDESRVIVEEI